jgi:branched-chain amino acid transport system substrate-binding protein
MERALLSLALCLTLIAAPACRGGGGEKPAVDDTGNFKIGVYADLSGAASVAGQSIKNGVQLAADEINKAGGIGGRQLEVVFEDDRGLADGGAAVVTRLVGEKGVRALIGGASPGSMAAAVKAQEAKVPLVTTSPADPALTGAGDYIFRVSYLDSFQGEAMAKYAANNLHAKTAAILSDSNSDYSRALSQAFEENFNKLGGQITQTLAYSQSDEDFKGQLTAIRDSHPDVIYVPGLYNQISRIARQVKELDIKVPLLGGDGWNDPRLFHPDAAALDGSYITGQFSANDPDPQVRKFTSDYASRFGSQPDTSAALAYDATKIMADALTRAGTSAGVKLRDAIAQTNGYKGLTRVNSFNADRNAAKPTVIFKIQGGKFYPVYREDL